LLTEKKLFCKRTFALMIFSALVCAPSLSAPTTINGVWQANPQTENRAALHYYGCGLRLFRVAKMKDAVEQFDEAIKLDPKCAEFYYKRGDALLELDRLDEAYKDFTKAIQLEPAHYFAYKRRGRLEFERGKLDASLKDFQTAVSVCQSKAEKADILKFVAKIHASMKKHDLAIADLTQALTTTRDTHALMLRGNQYLAVGEYQKAVVDYTEALSHNLPQFQDRLYMMRAQAYEKVGRFDLAKLDKKKAKDIVNDSWGGVLQDLDKHSKP